MDDTPMQDINAPPLPSGQLSEQAKLEAQRRTAVSYKNKFLNLRDRFDRVTAKNGDYHNQLATMEAKQQVLQDEINMLLDALMKHGAQDPKLVAALSPGGFKNGALPSQPSQPSANGNGSSTS